MSTTDRETLDTIREIYTECEERIEEAWELTRLHEATGISSPSILTRTLYFASELIEAQENFLNKLSDLTGVDYKQVAPYVDNEQLRNRWLGVWKKRLPESTG